MPEIKETLAEPERRDLVRRIAERGSRGYQIKETTVQPSRDYAAAAEAAFKGDPVVLPPAAQAELSGLAQAPAQAADRYAEAQRAIFARGQTREAEYGGEYFDRAKTTIGAINTELAEYEADLAKQAAEAAARRASSGGGGGYRRRGSGGSGLGIDPSLFDTTDDGFGIDAGAGEEFRRMSVGEMVAEFGPQTAQLMQLGVNNLVSLSEFTAFANEQLAQTGVHPDSLAAYVEGLEGSYRNAVERHVEQTRTRLLEEGARPDLIEPYLVRLRERLGLSAPVSYRQRRFF